MKSPQRKRSGAPPSAKSAPARESPRPNTATPANSGRPKSGYTITWQDFMTPKLPTSPPPMRLCRARAAPRRSTGMRIRSIIPSGITTRQGMMSAARGEAWKSARQSQNPPLRQRQDLPRCLLHHQGWYISIADLATVDQVMLALSVGNNTLAQLHI